MSLGDYVRVTRTFLEVFKAGSLPSSSAGSNSPDTRVEEKDENIVKLKEDLEVSSYLNVKWACSQTASPIRRINQNYINCELETIASADRCPA